MSLYCAIFFKAFFGDGLFLKFLESIEQGKKLLNYSLILDNLEAAISLDQEIISGGTDFSENVDSTAAIGYYAKGMAMAKKDLYSEANIAFEKCLSKDSGNKKCTEWLDNKDKLAKKIYSKAKIMAGFNPTKAKKLLNAILKLVTADNEYYKKAEADLKKM